MQVQVEEVAEHELVDLSVLGQNERIVEAGDQENIVDPKGHQVVEML